jgi:hypothetical protein
MSSANVIAAREAAALQKNRFVRIGYAGAPQSIKQLPRERLTPLYLNSVFNCDVEFLVEEGTGLIMWPKTWIADCQPNPTIYSIREKAWPQLDLDPVELDEYRGESIVIVESVPAELGEVALRTWITEGIDDDDPDLAAARSQLERLLDRQGRVEKQLKDLPNVKITTRNVTPKEELELRKKRAEILALEKGELEDDIRELTSRFELLRKSRETVSDPSFTLRLAEKRMPLGLNVWELRFNKDLRADRMAYIAAHKYNWSIFQLAVHKTNPDNCLVGKGEIKRMTDAFKEINMRNVTVSRKMHGKGMYKYPDERGLYSGRYRHGLRHGVGTEISQHGRFQCTFKHDFREGPCTAIYANGDTLRVNMGGSRFHTRQSLIFGDEYTDGVPNGPGSARFTGGSEYDGEFFDGVPHGQGVFRSAIGEVFEGHFGEWGTLEGYGVHTSSATMRAGTFRNGLLHGEGVEVDAELGEYEGDWRFGERCGFGVYRSELLQGRYEGWWRDGMRYGRGTMNYGHIDHDAQAAKASAAKIRAETKTKTRVSSEGRVALAQEVAAKGFTSQFEAMHAHVAEAAGKVKYAGDYEFEGRWLGNLPRAGGLFTCRNGHAMPNMHSLKRTHALRAVNAPNGFSDFDKREAATLAARQQVRDKSVHEALGNSLMKEAQNISTFRYWKKLSDAADPHVREMNRKSSERVHLEKIKEQTKKVTFKFNDMGDADEGEEQLAMSDEAIMATLKAEDDKLAATVAAPEEVRLGYFI